MAYITDNFQMNADLSSRSKLASSQSVVNVTSTSTSSKKMAIPIHVPSYVSELKRTELNGRTDFFLYNNPKKPG